LLPATPACSLTGDLTGTRPRPAPRHRVALLATLFVTWVLGTALGTSPSVSPARAVPFFQLEQAHVGYVPALDGSTPIHILVLGSDARPGEQITGQRADSIHLVSINPEKEKATIVGFPRDSWVTIPDYGTNKINAAMTAGGPQLVVRTVESLMGVTIDYWALTWFEGFQAMINDVGGLTMEVPFEVYDTYAHAKIDAGRQTLSGRDALAFARARHALPQGDFGRSENQGRLLVAALAQFRKEFAKDPSRLLDWVAAGLRNLRTEVPLEQIVSLAFTASTLNPKKVVNIVLPGSTGTAGGTSIVNLNQTTLQAIAKDLEGDGILGKKNIPPSPNAQLLPSGE
jgi:polyisoprenyl-teichoic acid--peptidoglycan teichoic acid transferase